MGWALIMIGCMVGVYIFSEVIEKWIKDVVIQCNVTVIALVLAMCVVAYCGVNAWLYPRNHTPEVSKSECQRIEMDGVAMLYWHEESSTLYCATFDFWQTESDYQIRRVMKDDSDIRDALQEYESLYGQILATFPT